MGNNFKMYPAKPILLSLYDRMKTCYFINNIGSGCSVIDS